MVNQISVDEHASKSEDQFGQLGLSERVRKLPAEDRSLVLDSFSAALADGQLPANDITVAMLKALDRSSRADLASTPAVGEESAPASMGVAASVSALANGISDFVSVDAAAADALGELLERSTVKR